MTKPSEGSTAGNRLTISLLVVYGLALVWILLLKLGVRFSYGGERRVNLIPFQERLVFGAENILNIVIFVPLGIYAGILFNHWRFGTSLLFFFLISFLVEGLQYMLALGAFDSTDLLTNTLGGIIGWLLYKAIERAFGSRARAQTFINAIAAIATVLMLLLLLLLKMNRLPIRYQ